MKLNCDLGESFGAYQMGNDESLMPLIDQANIACGFHAGDPLVMQKTLRLAKRHKVAVGAHPSYPDLAGFGRRSMACSEQELKALLSYQISALKGMAEQEGMTLAYVKPHGALYNDMMKSDQLRAWVMATVAHFSAVAGYSIPLMIQATPDYAIHRQEAEAYNLELYLEAFADRAYADDGRLLARSETGALLQEAQILQQVKALCLGEGLSTINGRILQLPVDSLCIHGDNRESVIAAKAIRQLINELA